MPSLRALVQAGHSVLAVYTQPDRPRGRGRKLLPSAVKLTALELGLPVRQPEKFAGAEQLRLVNDDRADLLLVVAYGQILPAAVLALPNFGALNVHASLLPRWRGAAPIQRALLNGDSLTGITLMQMEAGLDTGPMLLQKACAIQPDDTSGSLERRLADIGAACLVEGLEQLATDQIKPVIQPAEGITYAHKINKSEANIDWAVSALSIDRQIRAFNPTPAAFSFLGGQRIKILAGELTGSTEQAEPGTLVEVTRAGLGIATADGVIRITRIQAAGGKPMAVKDFLNAHTVTVGTRLISTPVS